MIALMLPTCCLSFIFPIEISQSLQVLSFDHAPDGLSSSLKTSAERHRHPVCRKETLIIANGHAVTTSAVKKSKPDWNIRKPQI
jgi:hypothetical protein